MKTGRTFKGFVDDSGHFALDDRKGFISATADFKGKEVELVLREWKRPRTLNQNRYWWAVPVKILAAECGYTPSQMHYALLGECFGYTEGPTGKAVPVKPSSSELNVGEFTKLIEWVLDWAPAELNCVIPPPTDPRAQQMMEDSE